MKSKKDAHVMIRMEKELRDKLHQDAIKEDRSISDVARIIIQKHYINKTDQ